MQYENDGITNEEEVHGGLGDLGKDFAQGKFEDKAGELAKSKLKDFLKDKPDGTKAAEGANDASKAAQATDAAKAGAEAGSGSSATEAATEAAKAGAEVGAEAGEAAAAGAAGAAAEGAGAAAGEAAAGPVGWVLLALQAAKAAATSAASVFEKGTAEQDYGSGNPLLVLVLIVSVFICFCGAAVKNISPSGTEGYRESQQNPSGRMKVQFTAKGYDRLNKFISDYNGLEDYNPERPNEDAINVYKKAIDYIIRDTFENYCDEVLATYKPNFFESLLGPLWSMEEDKEKTREEFLKQPYPFCKRRDGGANEQPSVSPGQVNNAGLNFTNASKYGLSTDLQTVTIPGAETVNIAWVSDVHAMMKNSSSYYKDNVKDRDATTFGGHMGKTAGQLMKDIVSYINENDIQFVVFGGDIADQNDSRIYDEIVPEMKKLNVDFMWIKAGHEGYTDLLKSSTGDFRTYFNQLKMATSGYKKKAFNGFDIVGCSGQDDAGYNGCEASFNNPTLLMVHCPYADKDLKLDQMTANCHQGRIYNWTTKSGTSFTMNSSNESFWRNQLLNENSNIYGVFAGHEHFEMSVQLNSKCKEHVFGPAFAGKIGIIHVQGDLAPTLTPPPLEEKTGSWWTIDDFLNDRIPEYEDSDGSDYINNDINYAEIITILSQANEMNINDTSCTLEQFAEILTGDRAKHLLYEVKIGKGVIKDDNDNYKGYYFKFDVMPFGLRELYLIAGIDKESSHYTFDNISNLGMLDRSEKYLRLYAREAEPILGIAYDQERSPSSMCYGQGANRTLTGRSAEFYIEDADNIDDWGVKIPDWDSKAKPKTTNSFAYNDNDKVVIDMPDYINQGDYAHIMRGKSTTSVKQAGCCDCSYIMIAEYLTGQKISIETIARTNAFYSGKQFVHGTFLSTYGLTQELRKPWDIDAVRKELKAGYPVVFHIRNIWSYNGVVYHGTENGHFLVIMGYTSTGFYFYDPGRRGNTYPAKVIPYEAFDYVDDKYYTTIRRKE